MTTARRPADPTATSVSVEREVSRNGNPQRLELGSRFGMDMRLGIPYRMQDHFAGQAVSGQAPDA
jgi:hypothetical protein